MGRATDVGAYGGSAEDERGDAPAGEGNADDHDERNHHGREADGDEVGGRFGGAEPRAGGESGEDAEELQLARAGRLLRWRIEGGRQRGLHNRLAKKFQQNKPADQNRDGHPEMNVRENAGEPALLWRSFLGHAALSEKRRRYARTNQK